MSAKLIILLLDRLFYSPLIFSTFVNKNFYELVQISVGSNFSRQFYKKDDNLKGFHRTFVYN